MTCTCGERHAFVRNASANPLNADPTRTTMIRRRCLQEMVRRFRKLKAAVIDFIDTQDAFGLKDRHSFIANVRPRQYEFLTDANKLKSFSDWFQQQVQADVFSVAPGSPVDRPWVAEYVESAYRRGQLNAYLSSKEAQLMETAGVGDMTQEQFLRSAFNQPETISKVQLLAQRAFEGMKGVTATMGTEMNRILAQGIADGRGAEDVARELASKVETLSKTRAMTIARTELIHAHAEGQLDAFDKLGIKEFGIKAEWSTAGDDRVCPLCQDNEGKVFSMDEARGMIPLHPNCRCSWFASKESLTAREKERLLKKRAKAPAPAPAPLPAPAPVVKPFVEPAPAPIAPIAPPVQPIVAPEPVLPSPLPIPGVPSDVAAKAKLIEDEMAAAKKAVEEAAAAHALARAKMLEEEAKRLKVAQEAEKARLAAKALEDSKKIPIGKRIQDKLDNNHELWVAERQLAEFKAAVAAQGPDYRHPTGTPLGFELRQSITKIKRETTLEAIKEMRVGERYAGKVITKPSNAKTLTVNRIKEAEEFLKDVVAESRFSSYEAVRVNLKEGRANYDFSKNTITIPEKGAVKTWIHEYGHHLQQDKELFAAEVKFLSSRISPGATLTNTGTAVHPEWTVATNFAKKGGSSYTGRLYNHSRMGGKLSWSGGEVMSTGLERLYDNPHKFFMEDPDFFTFIVDNITK